MLNLLLGEPLLPTGHNATTSMLCEVRYGERKQAIAHYGEGDDKRTKKLLDLTTPEHQENLRRIVTSTRINRDQLQATSAEKEDISESDDSNGRCVRLEILWPLEFVKVFFSRIINK